MDEMSVWKTVAERWRSLAREQKISVGVLAICGIAALGLSAQRVGAVIGDPFTVSKQKIESAKKTMDTINPAKREEEEAKRRDTDGDGISDYEEEKLFGTSPYLRDTDGDGSPDNAELAYGQNPNCAAGRPCASQKIDVSLLASSTGMFASIPTMSGDAMFAAFQRGLNDSRRAVVAQTGSTSTELQQGLIRDPVEIRRALLENGGIETGKLEKITDEQLLQLYDQAAVEFARKKVEEETGISNPEKLPPPDPSELKPDAEL